MIESVMSVMEGDEGRDRQNINNCFYFQRGTRTDLERQRIHKNS